MPTRDVLDERIDVWKDQYKDLQYGWRRDKSTTGNYGQVLRGNIRPGDQPEDGPLLPPNLKDHGWIDVYEAPNGFGWISTFEAEETTTESLKRLFLNLWRVSTWKLLSLTIRYRRTLSVHEDGPIVETDWVEYIPIEI